MGLLGNLFGGLGAGAGWDGAHNAHLAELAVRSFSDFEKKRVAEKTVEMGLRASGGKVTVEQFCNTFNSTDRVKQLNVIALALSGMNIHVLPEMSWRPVKNPFIMVITEEDIKVNAYLLHSKYKINISLGRSKIDIREWLNL